MANIHMNFNDGVFDRISSWIEEGSTEQKKGALWLVADLCFIEETGELRGNCIARKTSLRVWRLRQNPCNLLYRDRKQSLYNIRLTFDRAIDGTHDWKELGASLLAAPNGP